MRIVLNFALVCVFAFAARGGDGDVVVPKGIRYHKASEEANEAAKKVLEKLFSGKAADKDVLAILEDKLICGPGLWSEIKDDPAMSKLDKGNVVFQTPVLDDSGKIIRVVKNAGKLFQSSDEVLAFWKVFSKRTDFSGLKIRKLKPLELKIFWAMIPFDITEPIFILDSGKHKILVVFTSAKKLRIMWIDDYRDVTFKKVETSDGAAGKGGDKR